MSKIAVFCISQSRTQADRILDRLHLAGFISSEISILMPDTGSRHDIGHVKATKAPEGTATGAAAGGLAGGILGLLAGLGALAIPGVGPLIAAGPILAALSGAAVGAASGGVVGGLIGLGIPEIEARIYEGKLKTGNYLISVHAHNAEEIERAKQVYEAENAEDICTTSQSSVPETPKPVASATMESNLTTHGS